MHALLFRLYARAVRLWVRPRLGALFDPVFYLSEYPDVAASGLDPAAHYFLYGAREGRQPHRWFDTAFYLSRYPDVAASGGNPVAHYLSRGWKQNRWPAPFFDPEAYRARQGLSHTENPLLHYAAELRAGRKPRILPDLHDFLPGEDTVPATRAHERPVHVMRPGEDAGSAPPGSDIIVLSEDVDASGDWTARLAAAAYACHDTGTATPFTNRAGVCGYPDPAGSPAPESAAEQDGLLRQANRGRYVQIPEPAPGCIYVRRACWDAAGGYAPEATFAARARKAGWKHVLAADVYVAHRETPRSDVGARVRPPDTDPAGTRRVAGIAHTMRTSGQPVILAITHRLGGGVDEHLRRTRAVLGEWAEILMLRPGSCGMTVLENTDRRVPFTVWVPEYEGLPDLLRAFGVGRIQIHHVQGHRLDLHRLVHDMGVPFEFTVHDFHAACPQVTMTAANGGYCGEPGVAGCNACIRERPCGVPDIETWRKSNRWIAEEAERVIAPSRDAAARFKRYFPAARIVIEPHAEPAEPPPRPVFRGARAERLRVAVLGTMAPHKGLTKLSECAALAGSERLPLDFRLIGTVHGMHKAPFPQTGPYIEDTFPGFLAAFDPHVVWFPGEAPETYSFTLSLCLVHGLPVAAPDIGAFPERLAGRPCTWVLPHGWTAAEWARFFCALRAGHTGDHLA